MKFSLHLLLIGSVASFFQLATVGEGLLPVKADLHKTPEASEIAGAFMDEKHTSSEGEARAREIDGWRTKIELARRQRKAKDFKSAELTVNTLLVQPLTPELTKDVLIDLSLAAEEQQQVTRAINILSEYRRRFPDDSNGPDILLKQGLLYRQLGASTLALSKFYGVMTASLGVKAEHLAHYQKLVTRAQIEIAESHFLEGKYAEAADFYNRILKTESQDFNRVDLTYNLIRSLHYIGRNTETVSQAQTFLTKFPETSQVPEVRFLLADGLKKLGRNREAMQQVLILLESQQGTAAAQPQNWVYWQQRTGNEIANQLYREGDYLNALEVYFSLAKLDPSPGWQWPVLYQVGLIYEHLKQPQKASETFQRIVKRQGELGTNSTPSLVALVDMAKWRDTHLAWQAQAEESNRSINNSRLLQESTNSKQ